MEGNMNDEFTIDTPEKAAWAMRKYRRLAQQADANDKLATAERHRIDAWLERVNQPIYAKAEFYAAHLKAYAMSQRADGRKSVDLPDGVVKTRVTRARVVVDKTAFVQWAIEAERTDLLRTTYAPDMDVINDTVVIDNGKVVDPATGEVVPNAEVEPERVNVSITPDMDAIDIDDMEDDDA